MYMEDGQGKEIDKAFLYVYAQIQKFVFGIFEESKILLYILKSEKLTNINTSKKIP